MGGPGIEHAGFITNHKRTLGSKVFVGNEVLLSVATPEEPDSVTLGNYTYAPSKPKSQHTYMGSPAVEMPNPLNSKGKNSNMANQMFEEQPLSMEAARAFHNIFKIACAGGLHQALWWI